MRWLNLTALLLLALVVGCVSESVRRSNPEKDTAPPASKTAPIQVGTKRERKIPGNDVQVSSLDPTLAAWEELEIHLKDACKNRNTTRVLIDLLESIKLKDNQDLFSQESMEKYRGTLSKPINVTDTGMRMLKCAKDNGYLNAAMQIFRVDMQRKLVGPRKDLICKALVYSTVLDRLVSLMREDYRILETTLKVWPKVTDDDGFKKYTSTFGKIKYFTIRKNLESIVKAFKKGEVDPNMGRIMLPLNILEAVITDFFHGNSPNAKSGLHLAFNPPGSPNEATGAGKTTIESESAISKALLLKPPLSREWTDLYSVWNTAFVMRYNDWPLFLAKLFTPAVGCYADHPHEYLYRRGLGLWVHLNALAFLRIASKNAQFSGWDLDSTQLKDFGYKNLESAQAYIAALRKKDPPLATKIAEKVNSAIESVKTKGSELLKSVETLVSGAWDSLKAKVSGLWGALKSKFSAIKDQFKSVFGDDANIDGIEPPK